MKVFRCRVCGEAYLGLMKPPNCPYCTSHVRYMVLAADYVEHEPPPLTPQTKERIAEGLNLEAEQVAFYKAAAGRAQDSKLHAVFRLLARVEAEHVNVLRKLVGSEVVPSLESDSEASDAENIKRAVILEEKAAAFFTAAAAEAFEDRAVEVFAALGEADGEHLALLRGCHAE